MKKLLLALTLCASMSQAFGAAAFIVANGTNPEGGIGLGGLLTTTTTSVYASPLAGLVVFLEDGSSMEIADDSPLAQELLEAAEEREARGEELSEDDEAILNYFDAK